MFGAGGEFRERVKLLRTMRRWDQGTLGERAGMSAAAVSQIENGRATPTAEQVAGLSAALGYSTAFMTAESSVIGTTRPWLRAYADASKREADARTAAAAIAAEYIRRLALKPLPDLLPHHAGDAEDDEVIEELAQEMRYLAKIDQDAVVTNAVRAAERLGCVVLPLESELGRHLGMSVRADDIPILCVAKDDVPGDRQRWTVAHELGHLALHGTTGPPRDAEEATRMEKQAHRFAAAFLGPADALIDTLNEYGGKVTLGALQHVKSVWGISIKALVGRYRSLGVIDAEHARSLYKQISARKWSKDEPVDVPNESAQWLAGWLVRKAAIDDLPAACRHLAAAVGGNGDDLLRFADWSRRPQAEIVNLADRRRRSV
ncbi:MAG TPA: XRE family transcriptional regulator [Acidimicrobiales bacterium]|nr:XRE family transcriptional regulator [Acidimicrobiales bacterium]